MTSQEIRQQFLDFFKSKDHKIVPSAPVVPFDDPTLLFANAGMNQFKDVFLGKGTRDYKRAADTQKCIRVSGKHNDLEEVGHDTYHHTFFEMLGNWSFGDYYKEEAITWAWELLTEVWKLPKERLWITVYETDDESFELWKTKTDINPKHILKFGAKDNFWEMGDTGPCGPCSEIHMNIGDDFDNPDLVNADSPECIEIWNLVFIQYNKDSEGKFSDLPSKHVDTGMGFERICAILQNKTSNYDTDIFKPIIDEISKISKMEYSDEAMIPMRVIADHVRTLTFAIADGAVPGNEGRSYVLRRILRRAARYGRKLDLEEPFLYKLVDVVVNTMGNVFPEIKATQSNITKIIKAEEKSFNRTLDKGIELFEKIAQNVHADEMKFITEELEQLNIIIKGTNNIELAETFNDVIKNSENVGLDKILLELDEIAQISEVSDVTKLREKIAKAITTRNKYISGDDIFKLYDTFGFPHDLLEVMAHEKGLQIDRERFNHLMEQQKERARKSTKNKLGEHHIVVENLSGFDLSTTEPTEFLGYDTFLSEAKIVGIKKTEQSVMLILDKTPFYVEAGGQISDEGVIAVSDKLFEVTDLYKINSQVVHIIETKTNFSFELGMSVFVQINEKRRWDIMRNHSATHILNAALREILGTHVKQSGSYVGPSHLRFDFTHFQKVTDEEITKIEKLVNSHLRENIDLNHHRNIDFEKAQTMGALMFFGDKYGNKVNVVQFGDFSKEFCGGTHVRNSSQIGLFKITSESSIASGIRRIEAVTGFGIQAYIEKQDDKINEAENEIAELLEEKKKLKKKLSILSLQQKLSGIDSIISSPTQLDNINIYKGRIEVNNMDELKSMGDKLREKMESGVGILISAIDEKVGIVCVVNDSLIKDKKIMAGKIVGQIAKIVGGGGGGRPHLATAGGKDITKIDDALNCVEKIVQSIV